MKSFSAARSALCASYLLVPCLLAANSTSLLAAETIKVEAYAGSPLGVARVTVGFEGNAPPLIPPGVWFSVTDARGRALYPAFGGDRADASVPRSELTEARKTEKPAMVAWFLFRGDEPFEVNLAFEKVRRIHVEPVADRVRRRELLDQWWGEYQKGARRILSEDESPALVANYLTSTLSRRLGLPAPEAAPAWWRSNAGFGDLDATVGLLTGAESIRLALQKESILRADQQPEAADQPLPKAAAPPPVAIPMLPEWVPIEEIARHVPEECFYMRFGSFTNFQWFRATIETWGGNLRDLVAVRGLDYEIAPRLERQLCLRESTLAKALGPAVISDVALLGTDTFFREGAAFGLVFESRAESVLRTALMLERQALATQAGATHLAISLEGHEVSFWSTPDNSVRSFHVVDGRYQLVTNSQTLARRFLEAGQGKGSLASLNEFRYARALMPASRDDAVFVHLSDPFFRNIVGPAYRVEMTRRMQAEAELELVAVARLAAKAEGGASSTLEELIEGGYLPPHFGQRADGSRPLLNDDRIVDSLRGGRRTFLPIPDVEVARVTSAELRGYEEFSQMYARIWTRTDPVTAAISRHKAIGSTGNRERIAVDLHVAPFPAQHYGFMAQFLDVPQARAVRAIPGALVQLELRLKGGLVGKGAGAAAHLAGALADFAPEFNMIDGRVQVDQADDQLLRAPAFLAEVGAGRLLGILGANDRPNGFSSHHNGDHEIHYYKSNTLQAMGTSLPFLERSVEHLALEEAARAAQLRMRIKGLAESKLLGLLTAYGYTHSRSISAGNLRLLDQMTQQLHVKPERAVAAAEGLLAARLVCPLGGSFSRLDDDAVRGWRSSAWDPATLVGESTVPQNYRFPLFDWLRELEIEFTIDVEKNVLATHLEIEIQER